MNHVYGIIIAGITIALVAIGINVYLWNDEIAETPPRVSTPQNTSKSADGIKKDVYPSITKNMESPAKEPSNPSQEKSAKKTPSFTTVRINADGYAVIAGRAAPNSMVDILDNGKILGQVSVDSRGEWVFLTKEPLVPGSRLLSLKKYHAGE